MTVAHGGVLFLDELGEFPVAVLEALRTPLEEGVVRIARARARTTLPARFLLVAAMNPCPCGFAGQPGRCRCSPRALVRYARRLSGPLLDRFDLCLTVVPPDPEDLLSGRGGEPSWRVAERVGAARQRAVRRGVGANADLDGAALDEVAPLDPDAAAMLEDLLRAGALSPRGLRRVRSVALTLADLEALDPPLGMRAVCGAVALRSEPSFVRAWAP